MIFDCNAKYIMTSEQQLHKIRKIMPECPNVEKVIIFDKLDKYEDKEIGIDEIMAMGDKQLASDPQAFVKRYESVGPDDYANIPGHVRRRRSHGQGLHG